MGIRERDRLAKSVSPWQRPHSNQGLHNFQLSHYGPPVLSFDTYLHKTFNFFKI